MNKVEEFLQHYSSQYYDPVKAHEYYMKNRKLKGRTTSGMSDEQKEAWSYAKDNITTEKKSKVEAERADREKKIVEFRSRAEEMRKRITDKLKELSENLSKRAALERERVEERKQDEIEQLQEIPKNISPEKRAKLLEKRKKQIADIREGAAKDKTEISENTKTDRTDAQKEASVQRENTRNSLKAAISGAREAFKQAKAGLDANYEKTYQNEYDKILKNVPGKKKLKRGKK